MASSAPQRLISISDSTLALAQASLAHIVSHVHIMTLPALTPFLPEHLEISFVQIGLAMTVFSFVSLIVHIPLGYLTDKIDARIMLVAGLVLGGISFASLAWAQGFGSMVAAMAAAGAANGVYHPAGYALIASRVDPQKVGRAFSIFTFTGFLGSAVTPIALYWVVMAAGIETACLTAGLLGVIAAGFVLTTAANRTRDKAVHSQELSPNTISPSRNAESVVTPAIAVLTILFLMISLGSVGIHNFSVSALITGRGLDIAVANGALTGFLLASAFGVLAGGFLADRTRHHGYVASGALSITAVLIAVIGTVTLSAEVICIIMTIAGFLFGIIAPSRDMLVRAAAPKGSEGRAFGIVSTGFNAGGVIGPVLFASLLDRNEPQLVFMLVAAFTCITVVLAFVQERYG